jgi:hypothetical protein
MPVHVDEMTSEINIVEGELPLTPAQIEKLVKLVMSRLDARKREASQQRDATSLTGSVAPSLHRD